MRRILFLIFFSICLTSIAQESITVEECTQLAIAQSSANVQKELNAQLLQVKLNDVSSHYYPSLQIDGAIGYLSQVTELPTAVPGYEKMPHDMYNVSLNLQQVVFDGMQATYGRKNERLLNKNEISKLDISIGKIKEQIISLYLNLLIIDKQIAILTNVEKTLQEKSDQLKAMLRAGVVYANSIAQLDLESLKIQQQKDELQANRESLIASLSILTGKDLSQTHFTVPELPEVENDISSNREEFNIFANTKESLEYLRKLHLSKSLPKIMFVAVGGYGRPSYNLLDPNFKWFYAVGLKFTIPLIDWARSKGVSDIINLQKSILESQESDFRKANQIAIQEKINEINRIEHLLILDEQITQKYQEIKQTASTQLLNGTITAIDYIKQQNDELQSVIAMEVHTIQLLKAKYELMALKGKL
ncbi:MAG: TolC family protein [Bacteroidales bacterium]|nr:TolC family protein [Bacteroidales bacterium]